MTVQHIDVNPQHPCDLLDILEYSWTTTSWAQLLYVHRGKWHDLGHIPNAPVSAPPFDSNAPDDDFEMHEASQGPPDKEMSTGQPDFPQYPADGPAGPPSGPQHFKLSGQHQGPGVTASTRHTNERMLFSLRPQYMQS